jgi:hypothetical protein
MRVALLTLLIAGCGSSASSTTVPGDESGDVPVTCTEAYDITFTPGTTFEDVATEAVVAWPVPGVTFSGTVERHGDALQIEGVLRNTTDTSAAVDYLTGGVMGISTNPFQVDIDVQPAVATGPEVYPAPRRATLPAGGSVTYSVTRCPTFPARVRWTFSPWRGDAVQGDVTVR